MSHDGERLEPAGEPIEDAPTAVSDVAQVSTTVDVDLTREAARQAFERILESRARRAKAAP